MVQASRLHVPGQARRLHHNEFTKLEVGWVERSEPHQLPATGPSTARPFDPVDDLRRQRQLGVLEDRGQRRRFSSDTWFSVDMAMAKRSVVPISRSRPKANCRVASGPDA